VSFDKPLDGDKWFTEVREEYVAEQREKLVEQYGEEAVEAVVHVVALVGDLIYIGHDNVPLIHAGLKRMAEVVNGMLPSLEEGSRTSRGYDHRDLEGCMDPIPTSVQDTFVAMVGTVLLHAKGGPFDSVMHMEKTVDMVAERFREEGRELR
jgi:hypothetical protein